MSKIHNGSSIYCSSTTNVDSSSFDQDVLFPISDCFFCPFCQVPKSKYQTKYRIVQKYCSNCLFDYSKKEFDNVIRCVKNCFVCPQCTTNLSIKVNDHNDENQNLKGKSFDFHCLFCTYSYKTGIVTKPKSLHSIINDEMKGDPFNSKCDEIFENLGKLDLEDKEMSQRMKLNLKLSKLDDKSVKKSLGVDQFEIKSYPIGKKLTMKRSHQCLDCTQILLNPVISQPTVFKFDIKFNAVEYLPNISMTKMTDYVFLLHFINPLSTNVNVNLSTLQKFILPKVDFRIGHNETKIQTNSFIKSIPTAYLTLKNRVAKSEMILRKGDTMYETVSYDDIEENLDKYIDSGANWYSIPILMRTKDETQIPLYVKLSTDTLPVSLKKMTHSFNVGYWTVINIPH